MKKSIFVSLTIIFVLSATSNSFSQSGGLTREFGLTAGAFTNFPCNKDYLNNNIKIIHLAPYVRIGRHEFYAGIVYPLNAKGLYSNENLDSRPGAFGGYKFYVFNPAGRENMYVNYAFQYLRFKGFFNQIGPSNYVERNQYINNVFSLGYVVYFDTQQRFGLYYSLGYVISQGGYKEYDILTDPDNRLWLTKFSWNHINTNVGLSFKLKSFDKKAPK